MADISVIVPILDDYDAVKSLLADLPDEDWVEVVLVDGGADLRVPALIAPRAWARVIRCQPGRGGQMNAGAAAASGSLLLFLHADSRLPRGWGAALRSLPTQLVGGWFRFGLDDDAWQARLIERLVAWRVRVLRLPYGDQGMFVRRDVFERGGGFCPWPLMEDVDFARRLVAAGPTVELPLALKTSARRWRRDGWFRRSARNLALVSLFFAGVSPQTLARWYEA